MNTIKRDPGDRKRCAARGAGLRPDRRSETPPDHPGGVPSSRAQTGPRRCQADCNKARNLAID
eukprot:12146457-Alexandrium_andersonii.AAC.1